MDLDPQGNEVHGLTGRNLSSSIPSHQRDEWWVRWPALAVRSVRVAVIPTWEKYREHRPKPTKLVIQLWDWTKGDIFHVLLLALPFAIAAGSREWGPRATFSLGVLALAGLEAMMTSSIERCCLSLGHRAAGFCADAITNITPTTTSTVALLMNQWTVARDIVVGSVLANILMGMGAAIFFGCLTRSFKVVGTTASEIGKITLLATAPIVFPFAMTLAYQGNSSDMQGMLVSISHGMTIILMIVYLSWICFRRVTHRERFEAEDTAGALVGSRLAHVHHVRISTPAQLFYGLIAIASFTANIFIARYVVDSIAPLTAATSIGSDFLSIVVIPLAVNCSNYVKATMLARCSENISLSVHVTFGAAVGNVLFSLPLLLFIAWGTSRPLLMDLPAVQLAMLIGSIWETFIILGTGRVNYLNGLTCISLFVKSQQSAARPKV